jgi:6-phosphogluconolactonase
MNGGSPDVCVLNDFAGNAARRFAEWAASAVAERKIVHVALAGGTTPKAVYEALAKEPYRRSLSWASIHFYQGDERPVPVTHPESNWGMACGSLLDVVGVPDANRHPMRGDAADLDEAARAYASLLRERLDAHGAWPIFDLILLGMGPDGHTASLFPDTTGLDDTDHTVVANNVQQMDQTRLTLTLPTINAAREVWFLVTGAQKAEMAARILHERDAALPAYHVQPARGRCLWLMDGDAAGRL